MSGISLHSKEEEMQKHKSLVWAVTGLLVGCPCCWLPARRSLRPPKPRRKVKVMVGGAPVTQDFARRIGADGYAPDASQAVALVKSLISSST